jgi:hypothetical protein
LGGSPALSGGDLVSTGTAVVGGAATIAAIGAGAIAAAAGATAVASGAGGASSAGAGTASRSMVGIAGASNAGNVPPPSSLPPTSTSNGHPKQPSPPSSGGAAATPPSSSTASSASARSVLSSLGGEGLAGSGFEGERPAAGFRSHSVPMGSRPTFQPIPSSSASPSSDQAGESPASMPGELGASTASSASDASSSAAAQPHPLGPTKQILTSDTHRRGTALSGAANRLRNTGQRFRGLPSDAAPHTQPPRMPIDHSD